GAERGNAVTLFGASREIGGKLRREAGLPGCEEFLHLIAWMERRLRRTDARLELGLRATVADVLALAPHTVILAAGSDQRRPENFFGEGVSARGGVGKEGPEQRRARGL